MDYMIIVMLAGLALSLLNCFMGYRLRKVWGCILGVLLGGTAGAAAGYYAAGEGVPMILLGAGGALVMGILAWIFYKLGVFILCGGLIYFGITYQFAGTGETGYILGIVAGVLVGVLAVKYEGYIVTAITGICGGIGSIQLIFALSGKEETAGAWLLGIVLSCIGIAIQYASLSKDMKKKKNKKMGIKMPGKSGRKKSKKDRFKFKNPIWGSEEDYAAEDYEETDDLDEDIPERFERKRKTDREVPGKDPQQRQEDVSDVLSAGSFLDLDDMNRELSKEITKICEEEEQN